jgi:hypothetical protein
MTRSPRTVTTAARRFARIGVWRQTWRNLLILLRERLGDDPTHLAELYRKGWETQPTGETGASRTEPLVDVSLRGEQS